MIKLGVIIKIIVVVIKKNIAVINYCYDTFRITYLTILIFLGERAFRDCSSLSHVTLTSGLTVIGNSMFYMGRSRTVNLKSVIIPSTVTSIGVWVIIYIIVIINYSVIIQLF